MRAVTADVYDSAKPLLKAMVLMLLLTLGLWKVFDWMSQPNTMPIKHVRIEAEMRYLLREDISKAISDDMQTGYFAINSQKIIDELTHIEWVKEARIRRVWPDTVVVSIKEQFPVAIWNETSLLNQDGDVFQPRNIELLEHLPSLSAVDSQSKFVLQQSKEIDQKLELLGLSVQKLVLSKHGSWDVVLSNGVFIKAGHQLPEKGVSKSLNTLAFLQNELLQQASSIDLRYPNGISVTWKKGYVFGRSSEAVKALAVNNNEPTKG
ncbi:MAG: hypothetical protein A6F72_05910 [Cycloclasticus sp. symbiont of Poecilosclerida sp. N]|nr:MAG: hypothetical protein A6F72_05910 [Cycloclasticus sp. symbiont of Poecilosclerida sp. N]